MRAASPTEPGPEPASVTGPPTTAGRARAVAYLLGVFGRVLVGLLVLVVLGAPAVDSLARPGADLTRAGAALLACLVLWGLGLPVTAILMAQADWAAAGRLRSAYGWPRLTTSVREPRTWGRPLGYAVVQLTLGGAAALTGLVVGLAAAFALLSPALVAGGDRVDIGPFTLSSLPAAAAAATVGLGVLVLFVAVAERPAQAHARLVTTVLTGPEQRLQRDLALTAASRNRVVRSLDLERRRIERDLHDGIQPQLMSVSMTLGLALSALPEGTPGREDVARAQAQARTAVEDLRRFVRAIHPQVLTDHGLAAAVGELTDNLALPAASHDDLTERPPAEVETNLYYCIAELLTNVVKHAQATSADITLARIGTAATRVTVRDDGRGGATAGEGDGGLAGIHDRVAALGGSLDITSPPGGPTQVTITVPDHLEPQDPTP